MAKEQVGGHCFSPARSRSPGRCRPGYLRGLPDGQAEGASLALGLPVAAAKWLSQLGCPAQDRLPPKPPGGDRLAAPAPGHSSGMDRSPCHDWGLLTGRRADAQVAGGARRETNRSRSFCREAAEFWLAPFAARELGSHSWLDLNVEDNLLTRSRGNAGCLAHRDPAPRRQRPASLFQDTGATRTPPPRACLGHLRERFCDCAHE